MNKKDKNLLKLLDSHNSLKILEDGTRVKCSLTGHEMPCRVDAVEAYINGKRFQRLSASTKPVLEPSVYSEFLVPSNKPRHEKQLFCKLTFRHLNDLPHHITQHVNGKKFQKAYARFKQCKETGETFKPNAGRTKPRARDGRDSRDEGETRNKKRKNSAGARNNDDDEGDGIIAENIDDDEDNDDDDTDSLSDLYPVDYFEKLEISAAEYNPMLLGNGFVASNSATKKVEKSSNLKRKLKTKKNPAALKTVKAKKSKP